MAAGVRAEVWCGFRCADKLLPTVPTPGRRAQRQSVSVYLGDKMASAAAKQIAAEQVVAGFNRLRQEQRSLASKEAELEMELNEHTLVIETLKDVDPSRKCYRMVGGVLVERTVKEVLPALENNKEQINKIIQSLSTQLRDKGRELNEFREKHNIRLMGEEEKHTPKENGDGSGSKQSTAGVLVS